MSFNCMRSPRFANSLLFFHSTLYIESVYIQYTLTCCLLVDFCYDAVVLVFPFKLNMFNYLCLFFLSSLRAGECDCECDFNLIQQKQAKKQTNKMISLDSLELTVNLLTFCLRGFRIVEFFLIKWHHKVYKGRGHRTGNKSDSFKVQ